VYVRELANFFNVPKSSFVIVDQNGREENQQLNSGRTENALSSDVEIQMIVNDKELYICLIPFTAEEFLKLVCD
jgi:hypothetical protein